MKAVGVMQVASVGSDATADRLLRAWDHATQLARRVTLLAAATSVVVGAMAPVTVATRVALAGAGVLFVAAALVDAHERRLPNQLLASAAVVALVPALTEPAAAPTSVAAGAALGGGLLLLVRLSRGVGMGDVKMAAVVGASLGGAVGSVVPVAAAIAAAAAAAATVGLVTRRASLPFGPALWLGWAAALTATSMGWWT